MNNIKTLTALIALVVHVQQATAQQPWSMQQCMQYAVEHNHGVRQARLDLDNDEATRIAAVGRFLPDVDAVVAVQYNFGRAIDPKTNTYTDVSTFYNVYSLQASLPVFDGFSRLHALKAAKASELMGRQALRCQQDQTAIAVLQAFVQVAYCEGLVKMAEEKQQETELLLRQTLLMEEVGRKSAADVAMMESQKAEADYELTRQRHLFDSALLQLKMDMAYPIDEELRVSEAVFAHVADSTATRHDALPSPFHPILQQAYSQMQTSKHEWRQARASFYPTLSLSAGLNTTYYHTLHAHDLSSFGSQFRNNMGEYVGATLSVPLFNRLQTLTSVRRAKNNYRKACEAYEQKQMELEKLCRETLHDWQGFLQQAEQMAKKVEADSLAHRLTQRQYEEGLCTAIDLRTTSAQLLQSKATLLQCRLMAVVKEQLLRYYHGQAIWNSESSPAVNVFVKPNERNDACIDSAMARKGRMKSNEFDMIRRYGQNH